MKIQCDRISEGCVDARATVFSYGKLRKMHEIRVGEALREGKDPAELVRVEYLWRMKPEGMCRVRTAKGRELIAGREVQIRTENGFQPIRRLEIGERVETIDGLEEVIALEKVMYKGHGVQFNLGSRLHQYVCNGFLLGDMLKMKFHL
ncbi:MAG: hypothetical protein ACLU61_05875 [Lachnospiraceae bacterium]